jgi:PAS domain S-box-containing protein
MGSGEEFITASTKQGWKIVVFRYSLPFIGVALSLLLQGLLQHYLPKNTDFPFAFFYLVAAFVSAWYGGYVPGALACLIVTVGFPLLSAGFSHLPAVDISRTMIFVGLSLMVSRTAHTERRAKAALALSNDELDRRARDRTRQLGSVVEQLQTEIDERRKTEAALRDSEDRVEFALEAAGIGHVNFDLTTGQASRSLRHDRIFGYSELQPEWTYDKLLAHVLPEDKASVAERFAAAIRGANVCGFECRIKTPDESVRWISFRGRIRRQESGNAIGMLGIVTNVTENKLAEERLRTQLERLGLLDQITRAIGERQDLLSVCQVVVRSVEDSLPIDFGCICLYDAVDQVLTVNSVGIHGEALGIELAMQPQSRINIDGNGLSRCVGGHLVYEKDLSQVPFPFPERLARAGLSSMVAAPLLVESQVFGVFIAARFAPDSFSSGECEFLRQLSEHAALAANQAQIYTALQQAYEDLRQTQQTVMQQERLRALGQMASGIAHDINNAISPIALYTESLLESEPGLSQRARQYLEISQRAIEDVAHTVSRMREFYRRDELHPVLTPMDMGRLVQQVLDLTRARWSDMPQQRGFTIHLNLELSSRLPAVAGVESEAREALTNLVFNALDAMPEGGTLTLRTRVTVSGHVDVEVGDTGAGMDEDTRRRCLEPFFTTKGERGTGLGLAMVYGIVQRHNAQIEIESAPGVGTLVRLRFPQAVVSAEGVRSESPNPIPGRLRILVVDDDPLLIRSLRDSLESDGHFVTTANGGQEGIDTFRASLESVQRFAAVFTDLGMPYVDGRKVASAVKGLSPETPVILLTGWGQRLDVEGGIPAHVNRMLSKPPKLRELRAALSELTSGDRDLVPAGAAAVR